MVHVSSGYLQNGFARVERSRIHVANLEVFFYSMLVVRWQQGKNGKEAKEETGWKSGRLHRGIKVKGENR